MMQEHNDMSCIIIIGSIDRSAALVRLFLYVM